MTSDSHNRQASPPTVTTVADLRARVAEWRAAGKRVAFAPTMGALHDGHLSLVRAGRDHADRVVASIFVNPAQFAPHEDFETYPRQLEDDLRKLAAEKADLVFLPDRNEMYPDGFSTRVTVKGLTECLDGATRPHFFGGVATVVCKLLLQCGPDVAVFGEKDYQQLLIIKRMVADLNIPAEIVGAPTVREADGLAMSSRNAYLTPEQREIAGQLNVILFEMAKRLSMGETAESGLAYGRDALDLAGFDQVDYLDIRDSIDLSPVEDGPVDRFARAFAAVYLGETRLIDNVPVPLER